MKLTSFVADSSKTTRFASGAIVLALALLSSSSSSYLVSGQSTAATAAATKGAQSGASAQVKGSTSGEPLATTKNAFQQQTENGRGVPLAGINNDNDVATSRRGRARDEKSILAMTKQQSTGEPNFQRKSRDLTDHAQALESSIANAKVELSGKDMATAAGHHHGKSHGHGKYYMYAESPKKGAYKMGFKRGNHKHMIERKESAHKGHVHGYFKWHDKKGKGSHKYEFKHYDKKSKHHGHY